MAVAEDTARLVGAVHTSIDGAIAIEPTTSRAFKRPIRIVKMAKDL